MAEFDIETADGRTLHAYDTGPTEDAAELAVFWHHGTPQLGVPPEPLLPAAAHAIERFAVLGTSGGGPHALGCAALAPDRVLAAVSMAGLAPFGSAGLDWFAGMCAGGAAELRASCDGATAVETLLRSAEFDPQMFTSADQAALAGEWGWLGTIAGRATSAGFDDDLAYVYPWGFEPAQVRAPVLLVHGTDDRVVPSPHSEWLAHHLPSAEMWLRPGDGHISVLHSARAALEWLVPYRPARRPASRWANRSCVPPGSKSRYGADG